MKTRLTAVTYLGFTATDRRLSTVMLPWLLKEIRACGTYDKLSITIEDGCLKAYNENFEPIIVHRLVDIIRASQVPGRPDELFYILLNEKEALLHCYLFKAGSVQEVSKTASVTGRSEEFDILLNEKEALLHCYLFKAGSVQEVSETASVTGRSEEFYILLNEKEALLHCYLFKAGSVQEVSETASVTGRSEEFYILLNEKEALHWQRSKGKAHCKVDFL